MCVDERLPSSIPLEWCTAACDWNVFSLGPFVGNDEGNNDADDEDVVDDKNAAADGCLV